MREYNEPYGHGNPFSSGYGEASGYGDPAGHVEAHQNSHNLMHGLSGIFGGILGLETDPYGAAAGQYEKYGQLGRQTQEPFLEAGSRAIPEYEEWLKTMSHPGGYVNALMGGYKESPYAKYQTHQATLAAENAASAGGLMGSTPFAQQLQKTETGIVSGDENRWLQNVLGVGRQYGGGLHELIGGGQQAANSLTNLYAHLGDQMGQARYGQQASREGSLGSIVGGVGSLLSMFL